MKTFTDAELYQMAEELFQEDRPRVGVVDVFVALRKVRDVFAPPSGDDALLMCRCVGPRAQTLMTGVPNQCLKCGGKILDTPQNVPIRTGQIPEKTEDYLEKLG